MTPPPPNHAPRGGEAQARQGDQPPKPSTPPTHTVHRSTGRLCSGEGTCPPPTPRGLGVPGRRPQGPPPAVGQPRPQVSLSII